MVLLVKIVLLVMGAVLLLGAREKKKKLQDPRYLHADAVITRIDVIRTSRENSRTEVTVEYVLDGVTETARLDTYLFTMHVGDSIDVLVDPERKNEVIHASTAGPLVMMIMGAVFLALSLWLFFR